MRLDLSRKITVAACAALIALPAAGQFPGLTLPPGGDNQKSVVTQYMGFASVTITYNSPDVTGPQGQDRRGAIWGQLVPWGSANLGFGNSLPTPWRAGANENTTVELSHDALVQGQPLAAGLYGLHIEPREDGPWTVIFSKKNRAWGSFFYDPADDALRVEATPEEAPFREWLSFDFVDRQLGQATAVLHWEELRLPIIFSVPKMVDRYVDILKEELTGSPGFSWQNWNAAAQFLINRDTAGTYSDLALQWADAAIGAPFVGQENFTTLSTKAQALQKLARGSEAWDVTLQAIAHATASAVQVHGLGRQLIATGEKNRALEVFEKNFGRFEGAWPTHVGMARGLSNLGRYAEAKEHAEKALAQAPDDLNRGSLETMIEQLSRGEDVN